MKITANENDKRHIANVSITPVIINNALQIERWNVMLN